MNEFSSGKWFKLPSFPSLMAHLPRVAKAGHLLLMVLTSFQQVAYDCGNSAGTIIFDQTDDQALIVREMQRHDSSFSDDH